MPPRARRGLYASMASQISVKYEVSRVRSEEQDRDRDRDRDLSHSFGLSFSPIRDGSISLSGGDGPLIQNQNSNIGGIGSIGGIGDTEAQKKKTSCSGSLSGSVTHATATAQTSNNSASTGLLQVPRCSVSGQPTYTMNDDCPVVRRRKSSLESNKVSFKLRVETPIENETDKTRKETHGEQGIEMENLSNKVENYSTCTIVLNEISSMV